MGQLSFKFRMTITACIYSFIVFDVHHSYIFRESTSGWYSSRSLRCKTQRIHGVSENGTAICSSWNETYVL